MTRARPYQHRESYWSRCFQTSDIKRVGRCTLDTLNEPNKIRNLLENGEENE